MPHFLQRDLKRAFLTLFRCDMASKIAAVDIRSRKKDHVDSARKKDVEYKIGAGFSDVRFVHDSLPELDLGEINPACRMFGKKLASPLLIVAITGGYTEAGKINLTLAQAAENEQVAFGLGSQRAMIEKPELASTYKVRKVAPSIPLIGNIGGCQLEKYGVKKVREALDIVEADALAVHLNPLQEICQPEGDNRFRGITQQLGVFARDLGLPVIAKETGAGISRECAIKLKRAGVKMIDVAGAGGTSWSKEEYIRSGREPVLSDWGNPTCECIAACSDVVEVIGSGGVRSGLDSAKAIALGAAYAGAALPFIRTRNPQAEIARWKEELRLVMLLCGSRDLTALKNAKLVVTGRTAEAMGRLGIDPSKYSKR